MEEISVILNVYKRPHTLERQINAILNQSVNILPKNIHVWYNHVDGIEQPLPKNKEINTYKCNYNTKFYGRFTIPLLCKTKYVAIFDDDIIPGIDWVKNCINSIKIKDGIYGGSGVILKKDDYLPNVKVGWNGEKNNQIKEVDLVGHAWFFKQEYSKFMWLETPPSWDNGEDMFFSYVAQKNNIKTFVPPHPLNSFNLWSNNNNISNENGIDWGMDKNAHSISNSNHLKQRSDIVKTLIKNGWKRVSN